MMEKEKDYNGWKNYETWVMNLWLQNEEPVYRYWTDAALVAKEHAVACVADHPHWTEAEHAAFDLADRLKDEMGDAAEDMLELSGASASPWSDLLHAALSEVDWVEIAEAFLEGVTA